MPVLMLLLLLVAWVGQSWAGRYAAWIKVPLAKGVAAAGSGAGVAREAEPFGRLVLVQLEGVPPTYFAQINGVICDAVATATPALANGGTARRLVRGTWVIGDSFDGPIGQIVGAIRQAVQEHLLLEAPMAGSLIPVTLAREEDRLRLPHECTFELDTFFVNEAVDEPIKCPPPASVTAQQSPGAWWRRAIWCVAGLGGAVAIAVLAMIACGGGKVRPGGRAIGRPATAAVRPSPPLSPPSLPSSPSVSPWRPGQRR